MSSPIASSTTTPRTPATPPRKGGEQPAESFGFSAGPSPQSVAAPSPNAASPISQFHIEGCSTYQNPNPDYPSDKSAKPQTSKEVQASLATLEAKFNPAENLLTFLATHSLLHQMQAYANMQHGFTPSRLPATSFGSTIDSQLACKAQILDNLSSLLSNFHLLAVHKNKSDAKAGKLTNSIKNLINETNTKTKQIHKQIKSDIEKLRKETIASLKKLDSAIDTLSNEQQKLKSQLNALPLESEFLNIGNSSRKLVINNIEKNAKEINSVNQQKKELTAKLATLNRPEVNNFMTQPPSVANTQVLIMDNEIKTVLGYQQRPDAPSPGNIAPGTDGALGASTLANPSDSARAAAPQSEGVNQPDAPAAAGAVATDTVATPKEEAPGTAKSASASPLVVLSESAPPSFEEEPGT